MRRLAAVILGLFTTLLLLEILLVVGQSAFIRVQAQRNMNAVKGTANEVRILTIGESTTAVAGDGKTRLLVPQTAYPRQLETILASRAPEVDWTVLNYGMMGGTTPAVLELAEPAIERFKPHIIIAMMGIKDTPDHRFPAAADLPWPLSSLRTTELILRLSEDRHLRNTAVLTDIERFEDLPRSLRPGQSQLRKFVREVRLSEDSATAAAIPDLEVATYLWFIQRHRRAEAVLRSVIDTHDLGHMLLARVFITNGEPQKAYAVLEEAIVAHPDEVMPRVALVEALIEQGSLEQAAAVLAAADAHKAPWTAHAYSLQELSIVRARLHEALGEYAAAHNVLDTVDIMQQPPSSRDWWYPLDARAYVRRGSVCLQQDDIPCATRALEQAVSMAPGNHAYMYLLSKAYRRAGRLDDEAEQRLARLELHNRRVAEYMEMAKLLRQMGHADEEASLFDEAVAAIPSLQESHARLYALAREQGIHLVVMQYPSFSLELLHKYAPPAPGVSFIDNESVFATDPDAYFHEPGFPHSFSHYTEEGARVLATHVADHILSLRTEGTPEN